MLGEFDGQRLGECNTVFGISFVFRKGHVLLVDFADGDGLSITVVGHGEGVVVDVVGAVFGLGAAVLGVDEGHGVVLFEGEHGAFTIFGSPGLVPGPVGGVAAGEANGHAGNFPAADNQVFGVFAAAGEAESQGGEYDGCDCFDAFHCISFLGVIIWILYLYLL